MCHLFMFTFFQNVSGILNMGGKLFLLYSNLLGHIGEPL